MNDLSKAAEELLDHGLRLLELPPPEERLRLRKLWRVPVERIANALGVDVEVMAAWEAGQYTAAQADTVAYARLLDRMREKLPPVHEPDWAALRWPADEASVRCDSCGQGLGPCERCGLPTTSRPGGKWLHFGTACSATEPSIPQQSSPRLRPPLRLPRRRTGFPAGPVAVVDDIDGTLLAHLSRDRLCPCPDTLSELLVWTHTEGLGATRLHAKGNHQSPLVVLTRSATARLGLPVRLDDPVSRLLPSDHPVLAALDEAGWRSRRRNRGLGPWNWMQARATPPVGQITVHLAVQPWGALGEGYGWGWADTLDAPELARRLSTFAELVIVPQGSTATSGEALMTALRPPKQWGEDPTTGGRTRQPAQRGALVEPHEPAPPEAPPAHPIAQGWDPEDVVREEAYDWFRTPTAEERNAFAYVVGLDVNMAFTNAACRLKVGYGPTSSTPEIRPDFDKNLPGCWYVDLSGIPTDPRLPSPFTASGLPPTGPAWYTTPTVNHAQDVLGATVQPIKAYLRRGAGGPYLENWNARLREAYCTVLRRLGIEPDLTGQEYFLAWDRALAEGDPADWDLLRVIKAAANGGIGKMAEGPTDVDRDPYERWPALSRVTWRPDIRSAIIATARVQLHRKMHILARSTGRYPLAVLSDCVVYPAAQPTPFDLVPPQSPPAGTPASFTFGPRFGHVKLEGSADMDWAVHLTETGINPASWIKDPAAVFPDISMDPAPCDHHDSPPPPRPDDTWQLF